MSAVEQLDELEAVPRRRRPPGVVWGGGCIECGASEGARHDPDCLEDFDDSNELLNDELKPRADNQADGATPP